MPFLQHFFSLFSLTASDRLEMTIPVTHIRLASPGLVMWNSSQVSWVSELNTERCPLSSPAAVPPHPDVLALVPRPSGCASRQEQLAVSSRTAHGCRGCWCCSVGGDGGSWAQTLKGGEWVSQDEAGGQKRPVELFNRAERKHVQMNNLFVPVCRESAVIYCQCHSQHMGAGLAQGARPVADHSTNQHVLLQRTYIISWAGVIIGKQEICKELCSPEKLHSMRTNEFLENPKAAEAGRDFQACPVQAPLIAGPAGAGYFGPRPAAITDTHPGAGE